MYIWSDLQMMSNFTFSRNSSISKNGLGYVKMYHPAYDWVPVVLEWGRISLTQALLKIDANMQSCGTYYLHSERWPGLCGDNCVVV